MAARPIKTLAALLLSRRPRLTTLARFSSAAFNADPDATAGDVGDYRPANLSRESVIYGLKKLDKSPGKALDLFRWVESRSPAQLGDTAFAIMLRILAKRDWVKDFWAVVGEMPEKRIEFDRDMFKTLLSCLAEEKLAGDAAALRELYARLEKDREVDNTFSAAVEVIKGSDWGVEVEKKLDEIAFSVTDKMCLRMLRELQAEPVKALAFFRWAAGRGSDYKHNSSAYNAMVKIVGRNGLAGEFWDFVKEMKSEGFDIDYDTYVKLFRTFHKKKMMKDAVELYEMMVAGPYKPAPHDCVELLRHFALNDDVDFELVSRALKVHETCGYSMTKSIYDGMHRAFTGMGRFDEGEKIVQKMQEAGYEPDNITYSQLVFGLCKFGKLEDACMVLVDMEKRGCPPDIMTWTVLIQGHCNLGEVDKAMACYTKMIEKQCMADADLLQVLVKGLLGKNKVDAAYLMVAEIANVAKIRPWQATYKLLIDRLLGARKLSVKQHGFHTKLEEALNALKLMKKHGFPPYTDAFVNYISKFGNVQDAVDYFKVLSVKHYPAAISYIRVFEAFFNEGRQTEAQDLLYKCPPHLRDHVAIHRIFAGKKTLKPAADKEEKTPVIAD